MAIFSDVASAWKSTKMIFVVWRSRSTSASAAGKGILQRRHEGAALQVQHRHRRQPWRLEDRAPLPWRAGRIVQRTNEPAFAFEQLHDFLLVPEMIAAGDDVHARGKDFLRRIATVMPEPPAEFSPLATTRLSRMLRAQLGNEFLDRAPARLPYDVRDEQQFHDPTVTPRSVRGQDGFARSSVRA